MPAPFAPHQQAPAIAMTSYAAPAKLNLFLHVTGRRADGYHLLQSVFQLIDLADVLHFSLRQDGEIVRLNDLPGVPQASDLCVRAARLLQSAARERGLAAPGASIRLDKHIPMGGGLGGGSSDAATTLMALNDLWQCRFNRAELMQMGLSLGADVPFFLLGQNAFVEGIGERLTPLVTSDSWFIVIHPGVAVPTPAIFSAPGLTRDTKTVRMSDFSGSPRNFGKNDLQDVASKAFPAVADALKWLSDFGEARMTGSGACVFGCFDTASEADAVLICVPSSWRAWKTRALSQHPLAALLTS